MGKQVKKSTNQGTGKWFAPPSGGYSASRRTGETLVRPKTVPKHPASVSSPGASRTEAAK